MAADASVARDGGPGKAEVTNLVELNENSVLLEVGGELKVPNVESKEKLAELLASGKYVLDLSGAEIRISDYMRQEVLEALGLKGTGLDGLRSHVVLKGVVSQAPAGSHKLVRKFMRKGTREQHFAVVKELARMRREELENAITKPGRGVSSGLGRAGLARTRSTKETPLTTPPSAQDVKANTREQPVVIITEDATPVMAETGEPKKDKLSRQQCDELTTFRSATTASDLGTARGISDL